MTTVNEQREMLTFEEFREAVGASFNRVRDAIRALDIEPERDFADSRKTRYRREWVESVRQEIARARQ